MTDNCIQCGEYEATHGPLCEPCYEGMEPHDRAEWAETTDSEESA